MTHPDDLYAACFMLKTVIGNISEDFPATAAKLAGIEDYLRSCAEHAEAKAIVEARPSYQPKSDI